MGFAINIDTGGTFTDGFFNYNQDVRKVKVLTTPHDLTVCLADCVREGANSFGFSVAEMLKETDIIRYSTTIGTNTIIQRSGVKLGLVVSAGYAGMLYREDPEELETIYNFVGREMVRGISGEIDAGGQELVPLNREEVIQQAQQLIDQGAKAIVVSLYRSSGNPSHEQQVKAWIKEEFPPYYLGTPTVFLASEISDRPGEAVRTNTAVLNAYIHRSMARYLYKAEEDLRQGLFENPLLVVHNSGGVARVAKTNALSTYNSGPVAGLFGVEMIRKIYGFQHVVSTDMGGTSLDLSVIRDGRFNLELHPIIAELPVNMAMVAVKAIGAGGGSIAYVKGDQVEVGPASAGSRPGPACFDLGGSKPTVTDADLVLGFIDPAYFLGGKIKLNRDRAVEAINREIAIPLGISVAEAAVLIKEKVDANIAASLQEMVAAGKESSTPEALFAYGGAGPTHCAGYAKGLKGVKIITSPYASVFSAFGLSTMDLIHKYTWSGMLVLNETAADDIRAAVEKMWVRAYRDMRGEGFKTEQISYYLELLPNVAGNSPEQRLTIPLAELTLEQLQQWQQKNMLTSSESQLLSVVLSAVVTIPHQEIIRHPLGPSDPAAAFLEQRPVYWPGDHDYRETPVYRRELLKSGNIIQGPAVIEAVDTTCVVPPGCRFMLDQYLNGIMEGVE